jgi:hypothetical protein
MTRLCAFVDENDEYSFDVSSADERQRLLFAGLERPLIPNLIESLKCLK